MQMSIAPTQSDVMTAVRSVLLAMLPANTPVLLGQANRVPEPQSADFVMMTPIRRSRIETNTVSFEDCRFIGSVALNVLTVGVLDFGTVTLGRQLFGPGIASGVTVDAQLTGPPGEVGTYRISASTTAASAVMATGALESLGPYQVEIQLDFHSGGATTGAADKAQTAAVLFRDAWSVDQFTAINPDVTPLYADDPKQIPFMNGEGQWEDRWVVGLQLQVNERVAVPQQFMDSVVVGLIDVDAVYPP